MKFTTKSYEETVALGQSLGGKMQGGEILAFSGGLGVGKTAFCTGLARGMGYSGAVSSPTFAIVNVYNGEKIFAHFDAYRIKNAEDLELAGFYDYHESGAVIAVEWSENIIDFLPDGYASVDIEVLPNGERKISIKGVVDFQ